MSCVYASLLQSVEKHLHQTGTSASRFGRDIAGDPRLVFDMRRGRQPKKPLQRRLMREVSAHGRLASTGLGLEQGDAKTLGHCP